jgi:hypothetical protein
MNPKEKILLGRRFVVQGFSRGDYAIIADEHGEWWCVNPECLKKVRDGD